MRESTCAWYCLHMTNTTKTPAAIAYDAIVAATLAYFAASTAYDVAYAAEVDVLEAVTPGQTFTEALAAIARGEALPGPSDEALAAAEATAKAKEEFYAASLALGSANKAYAAARA